ncbi:hypothetical protein [Haliovirga abyssi]|uniref:PorV/PorQ family protein n=1 Tax=Haliovirga abyssi TaxID=2996794 RepID=A0AAU9DIC0_9FUSO|nr:hypothetical protein [Haliovirga abyssi]BDU50504.1 hypothetical protein HLVA_10730 [Haliovirga abyssi]
MMKKILILMLVVSSFTFATENAIFTSIPLDGKSSGMGGLLSLDSPIKYISKKNNSWNVKMSQKNNLGVVDYKEFELSKNTDKFGLGIRYEKSGDILKADKIGFVTAYKFNIIKIGFNFNLYNVNVSKDVSATDVIMKEAIAQGIKYEALSESKAQGSGVDMAISFDLNKNITIGYFAKNIKSSLEWKIKNEDNYSETLDKEGIFSIAYNKENIEAIGEIENGDRFNIGISRNYYKKLDLRVGMSRNLNSIDNIEAQKSYTVGVGFLPLDINFNNKKIDLGVDIGYEMKYFGNDDIFNGNSQDDITFTTYLKY